MTWNNLFGMDLDPEDVMIRRDDVPAFRVTGIESQGDPSEKVDIVIIPEGYSSRQMKKFRRDARRFMDYFFECDPFSSYRDAFNIWLIEAPSEDQGTDHPGKNRWKRTLLDSHFNTFGSDRYLTTSACHKVRDIAACAPYDQIYILVNSDEYGGGGIFNHYNLCTSDHQESVYVFVLEFGHAFAGLADEYAYEGTDAGSMYDLSVEPWQVNISTLADFDRKWSAMVDSGVPVPTPAVSAYRDKTGVFEGAGYVKKQLFRPSLDCRMRSNHTVSFCPVCRKALIERIRFYTQ
jgi:hypothetical protein